MSSQALTIPQLWESTALLIVYDEHAGIYDHVGAAGLPEGSVHGLRE